HPTRKQRNALLADMTGEVAGLGLRDNYDQTQAISTTVAQAASMVDVHARYIRHLEQRGRLDRALEVLPDDDTLTERKAAGEGLTPPEVAILLSYTKVMLYEELLASDLPDDPNLAGELQRYFATPVRPRFGIRLERATRWCLRNRPRPLNIAGTSGRFGPGAAALAAAGGEVVCAAVQRGARHAAEQLVDAGVPRAPAERVGYVQSLLPVLDLVEV